MKRIITITCTLMLCLATHAQRITASFQGTPLPDVLERLNILQHEYDICAINNDLDGKFRGFGPLATAKS